MKTSHCIYFGVSSYLEKDSAIALKQYELFHLFGGVDLKVTREDNPLTPVYRISGCSVDSIALYNNSGIKSERVVDPDWNSAFKKTLTILNEKKVHPVFANCFYLPYDKKNYKRNNENHLVLLEEFNEITRSFLLSDEKGTFSIDMEDLKLACSKTKNQPYQSLAISVENDFSHQQIHDRIREIMIANARKNRGSIVKEMMKLENGIYEINQCSGIHQTVALQALSIIMRHPNGTISSRGFMSESLSSYSNELCQLYKDLSRLWFTLANDLIRLSLNNIAADEIIQQIKLISKSEEEANNALLKEFEEIGLPGS
ncbi:hypothetical protein [Mesobacillus zeae]|uniref:Butirosin biosynthesis protein H N-terminal domain-containing protein n=1 Tax=Mesobacillus zeae TaxID=1917180 RepID=A0A398BJY9_9BACI|nr:hypothetical protein [Mesobacillus zeae]RID88798.1 hypothetical protein D1970_00695 [Mesobacillus zeae]